MQAAHVPPLQAVSQQTPLAQNPDAHWLLDVQASPKDASYRYAAFWTVVLADKPPAARIMFPLSSTA